MIACPSCERSWSTEVTLATHLMDAHGLDAATAVSRARWVVRDTAGITKRQQKKRTKRRATR